MEGTVKVGTRCECGEHHKPLLGSIHKAGCCQADAVRMVTVHPPYESKGTLILHRPMCEACATWHEKKGA